MHTKGYLRFLSLTLYMELIYSANTIHQHLHVIRFKLFQYSWGDYVQKQCSMMLSAQPFYHSSGANVNVGVFFE